MREKEIADSLAKLIVFDRTDTKLSRKMKKVMRTRYDAMKLAEYELFKRDMMRSREFVEMVKEITGHEVTDLDVQAVWNASDDEWGLEHFNKIFITNVNHVAVYCNPKCGEYGCRPSRKTPEGGCEELLEYVLSEVAYHRRQAFQFREIKEHFDLHFRTLVKAMKSWFEESHDARFRRAYEEHRPDIEEFCDSRCGRGLCYAVQDLDFPRMWECTVTQQRLHCLLEDGPGQPYEGWAPKNSEKVFSVEDGNDEA